MARIAIGGLHHETNSFAPQPADFASFVQADGWPGLQRGPGMFAGVAGVNLAITGFIDAATARGHELVPTVWANACPSGPVTEDAYECIVAMLLEDLGRSGAVDALFLDLHGAMVTEHLEDGEGELLRRVRDVVGDLPIVAALDLHANVSDEMVARADILDAYRTYPHIDLAETGARCVGHVERLLGGDRPAKALRKADFLVPLVWQCTTIEPACTLYAEAARPSHDGGEVTALCMGFPAADTPACGPAVLAYAADKPAAAALADALAAQLDAAAPGFRGELLTPEVAVARALAMPAGRPVVLADVQDNPGGGGTSDTTDLLAALVEAGADGAVLALLHDPAAAAAAHAAGPGAEIALAVGGRTGPAGVRPFSAAFVVERIGEGRFVATGPMYRGSRMDLGPMALLRVAGTGVRVVVSTRRVQAADQAMLRHLGIEPAEARVLALKSSVHFRADFEPIAQTVLLVRAPGAMVVEPRELPFRRLRPGLRLTP